MTTAHTHIEGPLCLGWEEANLIPCDPRDPYGALTPDCEHHTCWAIVNEPCLPCEFDIDFQLEREAFRRELAASLCRPISDAELDDRMRAEQGLF